MAGASEMLGESGTPKAFARLANPSIARGLAVFARICPDSGEFTSPGGGVKPPLHQTNPLPARRLEDQKLSPMNQVVVLVVSRLKKRDTVKRAHLLGGLSSRIGGGSAS